MTREELNRLRLDSEETRKRLSSFRVGKDVLFVVYESFKAQSRGLEPHPKVYIGLLDSVREDGSFLLSSVLQRGGGYRGFNPAKGYLLDLRLASEEDLQSLVDHE